MLQAGLNAKVESVEEIEEGKVTVFNLYISDASVEKEIRKRTRDLADPVIIYGV